MCMKVFMSSPQTDSAKRTAGVLSKRLLIFVAFLLVTFLASAADPLGATLHKDASTTFRVWAPFVDSVAVKINDGAVMPLTLEPGHADPADTTWIGTVPRTKAGDQYRYVIRIGSVTREFNDPRAQQLTGFDLPDGYGLPGNDDKPRSVIVDPTFNMPAFAEPTPADHDWGYDPVQLFAIKSRYGTPRDFKGFVKQCHQRQMAVIVDVVYNHLIGNNLLNAFGGFTTPQIPAGIFLYGGDRANTGFGPRPDFGRPQVRQYIIDNALLLLRGYAVDGLRFDDTIDIRTFGQSRTANREGLELLREINFAYRNTDPKQPGKITIAEDLQSSGDVTLQSGPAGLEFNSQWDDTMVNIMRGVVTQVNDSDRDIGAVKGAIEKKMAGDVFSRVVYTENHDQVGHPKGQVRLPAMIAVNDHESVFAKQRSTLAAAIMLTSPGIPMLFQGQEMLETRAFGFNTPTEMDFTRADDPKIKGIVQMYRDLIALRRNLAGKTRGLTGQNLNVFHLDNANKTLAYHRWENGGPGDDVVIVANFSNVPMQNLNIGFPRQGQWHVLFNSGASVYDPGFTNGDSFDTTASPGAKDGLNFNGNVGIGAYSVVILSQ